MPDIIVDCITYYIYTSRSVIGGSLRKLAIEAAARGESLVVKIDGEIKDVPAKELLKTLPKE